MNELVRQRSSTPEDIQLRSTLILKLRLSGLSIPEIAETLGLSPATVLQSIKKSMLQLKELELESAEELVALEVSALNELLQGVWQRATKGDNLSVDRALKILEARRELLGLKRLAAQGPIGGDAPPVQIQSIDYRQAMNILAPVHGEENYDQTESERDHASSHE